MRTTLTALDVLAFDLVIGTLTRAGRVYVFVRSLFHACNVTRFARAHESETGR